MNLLYPQAIDYGKLTGKMGKHLHWCIRSIRSYTRTEDATCCDARHTYVAVYRNVPIQFFSIVPISFPQSIT